MVTKIDGEPWFVAKDVCTSLGIPDPKHNTSALDDDEKGRLKTPTLGGEQELSIVSETGMYKIVMRISKKEAKLFQREGYDHQSVLECHHYISSKVKLCSRVVTLQ